MVSMSHNEFLERIGFSKSEAIVYLALLKLGITKSGKIIKLTGLQSSVIHNALNTLLEKGFITYILQGSIKQYKALNPEIIEQYLDSKKTEFSKILPSLKAMEKDNYNTSPDAEVYEGYNGLFTATLNLLQNSKKGDIYKYFAISDKLLTEETLNFFKKTDKLKKEKKITVKGVAESSSKKLKLYSESEIRFVNQKIPPAMNIFEDKILLMTFENKPTAVLIHSKEIAQQYTRLWDSLWKISKKK